MTNDQLEKRLHSWYLAEVRDDEAAPITLRAGLAEITTVPPAGLFRDRRTFVLLAAAAVLAVAAIGSAVAIGSGFVRTPAPETDLLVPIFEPCEPALPEGVLLTFDPAGRQADGPPSTVPRYVLYESGQTLRYEWSTATEWDAWRQRRMAPEGVRLLLDSVQGVNQPSCEPLYLPEYASHAYAVTARSADDAVRQLYLGSGLFEVGFGTEAAHAAAADLVTRFADPDLKLPPADWVDTDWQPYAPERYSVVAYFPTGMGDEPGSEAWDVTLPDGSTLKTFGETTPGTEAAGYLVARCGAVAADEARAIVATLEAAPAVYVNPSQGGSYLDLSDGGSVTVIPALPHEATCQTFAQQFASHSPTEIASPEPAVANLWVCDLLPSSTGTFHTEGGWTQCAYASPMQGGPVYVYTYARLHETSGEEALQLARFLFGEVGFVSDQIHGRTVYLNDCISSPIPCSPAIAISADPYFVIVEGGSDGSSAALEDNLRSLAEAVIENLEN
jgi:hypothetical protein